MKVVLFCGGQGLRLREYSDRVPKPMVPVGPRPIMWHLMKYYAHFGHTDFILALGHQGEVIKDYFLNYNEAASNDFILHGGSKDGDRRGRNVEMLGRDIDNWTITFVDTGLKANIGERLCAVREHLGTDEWFLANYSDNLSDVDLPDMIERAKRKDMTATFAAVYPAQTFHTVAYDHDGTVSDISDVRQRDLRINGGFFVLNQRVFDVIEPGEELVLEPFGRLIQQKKLKAYQHPGFWAAMDTFKEKMALDDMVTEGVAPWEVWKKGDGRC
ncbi:MAG: sugar phosphate nucleotidyltransferase [Planctomycetota bacterium]